MLFRSKCRHSSCARMWLGRRARAEELSGERVDAESPSLDRKLVALRTVFGAVQVSALLLPPVAEEVTQSRAASVVGRTFLPAAQHPYQALCSWAGPLPLQRGRHSPEPRHERCSARTRPRRAKAHTLQLQRLFETQWYGWAFYCRFSSEFVRPSICSRLQMAG